MKLLAFLFVLSIAAAHGHHNNGHEGHHKGALPTPISFPPPVVAQPPIFPAEFECTAPATTCPAGFVLQGHACVQDVTIPAEFLCHAGVLHGDVCISRVPTIPTCAEGMLRGEFCVIPTSAEPLPVCPAGFTDIGSGCRKSVPAPILHVCTSGSRVGDECVLTHSSPPTVNTYCPEGFNEEDGECCRIETYDCTPPGAQPLECGDDDEFCEPDFRYLKGSKGGYKKGGFPVASLPTAVVARERTAETAVIQQTCQKKIVRPAIRDVLCGVGELQGGSCILKEVFPLTPKCSVGGMEAGGCFTEMTAAYLHQCPEGYSMSGGRCSATEQIPAVPSCPLGFEMARGECTKPTPATPTCRRGLLKPDGLCHDNEFAPPTTTWCVTCTGSSCHQVGCGGGLPAAIGAIGGHKHH